MISPDGVVTVTVPPGALSVATDITIQQLSPNLAPNGQGPYSYEIGPSGQTFLLPVTVAFQYTGSLTVNGVTIAYLGSTFWLTTPVARDAIASTVSTTTTVLGPVAWALVATGPNLSQDLVGTFSLSTTVGIPYSASGNAVLSYSGTDSTTGTTLYFPVGSINLETLPVVYPTTTCTPVTPPGAAVPISNTALVQLQQNPPRFLWGIDARWSLTCADASTPVLATQFDTVGIELEGCARSYVGTPIATTSLVECDSLNGCSYVIDCGANGRTTATWNFSLCPSNGTCTSAVPCHAAAFVCTTGLPVCTDTGALLPDGTACDSSTVASGICFGGSCVACGDACTPANPCDVGAIASCSTVPVCSDTGTPVPDGSTCETTGVCSAGACCKPGNACVPANTCDVGSVTSCGPAPVCADTGTPVADGTTCAGGVCFAGSCCIAGSACAPANDCHTGTVTACTPAPTCTDSGTSLVDGSACKSNQGQVCLGGACAACTQGGACAAADPCRVGALRLHGADLHHHRDGGPRRHGLRNRHLHLRDLHADPDPLRIAARHLLAGRRHPGDGPSP